MARKSKLRALRCPTCRVLVTARTEDFPFCSNRCRVIDLGKWASGGYVISTAINDPDQLDGISDDHEKSANGKDSSIDS